MTYGSEDHAPVSFWDPLQQKAALSRIPLTDPIAFIQKRAQMCSVFTCFFAAEAKGSCQVVVIKPQPIIVTQAKFCATEIGVPGGVVVVTVEARIDVKGNGFLKNWKDRFRGGGLQPIDVACVHGHCTQRHLAVGTVYKTLTADVNMSDYVRSHVCRGNLPPQTEPGAAEYVGPFPVSGQWPVWQVCVLLPGNRFFGWRKFRLK